MPVLLERKEEYAPISDKALPEKALARLWQKRAARQQEFRTAAGRRVRVLYPGRPGTAAGPDFRDAVLEVEGLGVVQGDVELHLRQQDWYAHGHADDPNYNGVVLHAALETSSQPTNLNSGHRAPVISLAGLLEGETLTPALSQGERENGSNEGLWVLLAERGWPRPADAEGMGQLLDAAGDARFRAKAAAFAGFNQEQPPSQTLYEGLLEALGYRANRQPFLKLAQRAPWEVLAREALTRPPEAREASIERRLIQISGLASAAIERAGAKRRPPGYGPPLKAEEWHTFRVRPVNHPRHRIAGAARLLARFLEPSSTARTTGMATGQDRLVEALSAMVVGGSPAKLTATLTVPAEGGKGAAYVGAARAKDMAVNVALPFCHTLDLSPADGSGLALYKKFGKLQDNEITREMAEQLLEPGWAGVVTGARRQQGLIHLHRQLAG